MSKVVLFGVGDIAELAYFYLSHDSPHQVVAFTVDQAHVQSSTFCNLPVIPFEQIENFYPPTEFSMLVAIGYSQLNFLRTAKYKQAKSKGYHLISYISSKATVWSDLSGLENCFILEDNTIQPFVRIGHNVVLWSGNHIGHHVRIGDNCFIASHAVISGGVEIGENCFIGVNATIRDHIKIAENCIIGAGVTILRDTQPNEVYVSSGVEPSRVPSSRVKKI